VQNLVWSFAPWFVFVIAARFSSLKSAIGAGVLGALIACGRAAIVARVHLLDVAGVGCFVGLSAALLLDPDALESWSQYAQFGSHVLLTLPVFGSIVVAHSFTEACARETTPSAVWSMPEFHAINRRIAGVWGLALLVGTVSVWAATTIEPRPILLHALVPFGALYLAYRYTTSRPPSTDTFVATT
jgi:hypothetical protein